MDTKKRNRLEEITRMLAGFCKEFLNEKFFDYSLNLLNRISRKRNIDLTKGAVEIWATAIIHVIARLNYLYDKNNPFHFTLDDLCGHFNTNKSTIGNKASSIMDFCITYPDDPDLCLPDITDMFTFYETPEGFIIPKSMIDRAKSSSEEENAEHERRRAEQERIRNEQIGERKRLQDERKRAEKELKEKDQLRLFE